ncbi:MAG: hypothetical protein AAGF99_13645 [Bacteroidota bacterium]
MSLLLGASGLLLIVAGSLYILVRAFAASLPWGIACLLVGPVMIVFTMLHWDDAKAGALAMVAGMALLFVGGSLG